MEAPKGDQDRGQQLWWERGCGGSCIDDLCSRALEGNGKARGKGSGVQPEAKVMVEGG